MATASPLPETWNVPEIFRQRLGESAGRQRAMHADGHLLLVLHAPPRPDDEERAGRFFWRSPDGVWDSTFGSDGTIRPLRRHIREYREAVGELEDAEEAADRASDYFAILRAVAPLRRASRHMYETLQDARQMIPHDREVISCRDQAFAIERSAELLETETKNGLDYVMARKAEDEARSTYAMALSSHRLNVLAAVFFPIFTVTAIFGMNLDHGLEDTYQPWLFWSIVGAGVIAGFFLCRIVIEMPGKAKQRRKERY